MHLTNTQPKPWFSPSQKGFNLLEQRFFPIPKRHDGGCVPIGSFLLEPVNLVLHGGTLAVVPQPLECAGTLGWIFRGLLLPADFLD